MNDLHEQDLIRKLVQLGEVTPTVEATRQALDRVRSALVAAPTTDLPVKSWTTGHLLTAAAGVVLVVGGLAGWFLLPSSQDEPDFSAVRAAMKAPASVTYRQTTHIEGEPDVAIRLLILASGLWRAEKSDGSYTVMDAEKHRALLVNPNTHEAALRLDVNIPRFTLYDAVKNLPSDKSASPLPRKKIDDRVVRGFAVKSSGQDVTLWIDPQTYLPVQIECELKDNDGKTVRIVLDQFAFDNALDPELFNFDLPAGYKTPGKDGELSAASDSASLNNLVVTPLVGIGPVKFGMSRQEVEKLLGKSDRAEETKDGTTALKYGSNGFSITVSKDQGVSAITCLSQGFSGKTDKGIALGASTANILAAYGEPDARENAESKDILSYNKLQISFTLVSEQLVQMQLSRKGN